MPRKFSAYLLAIAAAISVSSAVSMAASRPACADTLSVDTVLAREADAFLRSLSEGLQKRQEEAVRRAMAGDDAALEAVRASRNAPPQIPADVVSTDISEIYRLYRPASSGSARLPVLIYLHGGGWCFGSINSCARFCAELSRRAGVAVLAVDYPLAPRYPFPHALDASLEAVGFALANAGTYGFDIGRISLGGDSAGGNLALAAALAIVSGRSAGDARLPADALHSLVLFYPVVKAWNDRSESWKAYGSGYGLDSQIMDAFNEAYAGEADARDPLLSPFCAASGSLAQLPPVMMVSAGRDILRDQAVDMASWLREAGVEVCHSILPSAVHLFITVPGQPRAFEMAVDATSTFLTEK